MLQLERLELGPQKMALELEPQKMVLGLVVLVPQRKVLGLVVLVLVPQKRELVLVPRCEELTQGVAVQGARRKLVAVVVAVQRMGMVLVVPLLA